eukprot:476910-Rhodomonas_salina.1
MNPAQAGYVVDNSKNLYLKISSIHGVNSRELLRDVLIAASFQFPSGTPTDYIHFKSPKARSRWSRAR